jgi:hypothetical protein
VFQDSYGWNPDICGLAYVGVGLGFLIGLALVARLSDATVIRMTKANNGIFEPEMRLPSCVFFAMFVPITFFLVRLDREIPSILGRADHRASTIRQTDSEELSDQVGLESSSKTRFQVSTALRHKLYEIHNIMN